MLFSSSAVAFAQGDVITGKLDYGFPFELNTTTGVLTISGLGMLFCGDVESPLGYCDEDEELSGIKEIIVKEGISLLNLGSFFHAHNFNEVTSITFPRTLKRICKDTFSRCASLQTINYGGSEEDWKAIVIDEGNDAIKKADVNYNCTVPATEGADTFDYSMVQTQQREKYVTTIDYYTSEIRVSPKETSAKEICFNEEIVFMFEYMPYWFDGFYPTYMATSLVIEEGITALGSETLRDTNIETISIPKSLVKIKKQACGSLSFIEKSNLKKIYYAGNASDWKEIDIGVNNGPILLAEKVFASKVRAKDLTYTLSKKNFVYNGKAQYPTVTIKDKYNNSLEEGKDYIITYYNVDYPDTGVQLIKVDLIGEYKGKKELKYYVKPKAPKIAKLTKQKGAFTVVWEEFSSKNHGWFDRYEIQYSTSPDFKSSKTVSVKRKYKSRKIKNLKSGKKYYVRIRGTLKDSGVNIRSAWSKTVSIKAG